MGRPSTPAADHPVRLAQRYISPYLTHFVGRSLATEEERYQLLLNIIKCGMLLAPGLSDIHWGSLEENGPQGWVRKSTRRVDYTKHLSENVKYISGVICFCDIPEADIGQHAKKYSSFGVAFPKEFLVHQGATPVMYIASQAITDEPSHPEQKLTRAEFYDAAEQDYCRNIIGTYPKPGTGGAWSARSSFHRFVEHYIFPFMKFFDAGRPDDDPSNFYMEREWRLVGVATFRPAAIARVYVPADFRQRALADIGLGEAVIRTCPGLVDERAD